MRARLIALMARRSIGRRAHYSARAARMLLIGLLSPAGGKPGRRSCLNVDAYAIDDRNQGK